MPSQVIIDWEVCNIDWNNVTWLNMELRVFFFSKTLRWKYQAYLLDGCCFILWFISSIMRPAYHCIRTRLSCGVSHVDSIEITEFSVMSQKKMQYTLYTIVNYIYIWYIHSIKSVYSTQYKHVAEAICAMQKQKDLAVIWRFLEKEMEKVRNQQDPKKHMS